MAPQLAACSIGRPLATADVELHRRLADSGPAEGTVKLTAAMQLPAVESDQRSRGVCVGY